MLPLVAAIVALTGCHKWDEYKGFIPEGEKIYPGLDTAVSYRPGNGRALLTWPASPDQRVSKYAVYWNNKADSMVFNAASHDPKDTVKALIENLNEGFYTFVIHSFDNNGNKSIGVEKNNLRVYGPQYQSTLLNRILTDANYSESGDGLTLLWKAPDTVNTSTSIWYTNALGAQKKITLYADVDVTKIADWKIGTKIFYQSFYKPRTMAIDSFAVLSKDSLLIKALPLSKTLWKKINLPNDVEGNAYGSNFASIWDGQAGGYPNIYHTQGGSLPHHFTIDLGGLYQLTKFEETGRTDCACHNPVKFEIWGIADLSNAATSLPADDSGWKAQSIAKGWKLLKEVERSDDGTAPFKVNLLEGTARVRYIRIRVTKTLDDSVESHMSEISFWYNP